jgi:ribosomal protein L14E/L6E/L27E
MEDTDSINSGYLVESLQGRDKGRIYLVLNKVNNLYVKLVDGTHKKIINPKLKKLKHIKPLNIKLDKIQHKLSENAKVFDSEIYSAIKKALESKS